MMAVELRPVNFAKVGIEYNDSSSHVKHSKKYIFLGGRDIATKNDSE